MTTNKPEIRVAILDLYDGIANEGMRGFQEILNRYKAQHELNLSYQIFDVRRRCEMPGTNFDIYISSGGPGDPLISEGTEWEKKYFRLIEKLEDHNLSNNTDKKHTLFVCHSFQLMCRHYKLGDINMRRSPSFGVLPVNQTPAGAHEPIFEGLGDPFYAVDSRSWQVINPDEKRFKELGMQLVAIEKERPHVEFPRAMMAIRYNDYFFATQFHPEADAGGMKAMLLREEKKQEVINEHGEVKYREMLARLDDPDKITHTQRTLIPNFLDQAVMSLQGVV
ncbi:GMP synthase-Glutamine amidotransferase [Mucilaginibacter sp. OK268]|uniref:type 1 glutamine amidotransferase n=1 Tax=Mucilaginibacter sp. OK268 TaxID=1881048 RepID=UPI00087E92E3|nr:GMP synthase [Mucilaginibacter sp. OK268]SDP94987.1 GMP synthase-Glutamine amidotransferase [Mucilaginibacter sp. OK268]